MSRSSEGPEFKSSGHERPTNQILVILATSLWSSYGPRILTNRYSGRFGSHPRRVFSVSYELTRFFHGANEGSNPSGDANQFNNFHAIS
jgi:hypothetical protein